MILAGIAVAVILDDLFRTLALHSGRNLWPIGVVFWPALGAIPIIVGLPVGQFVGRCRRGADRVDQ
jgi:hypothetical protein